MSKIVGKSKKCIYKTKQKILWIFVSCQCSSSIIAHCAGTLCIFASSLIEVKNASYICDAHSCFFIFYTTNVIKNNHMNLLIERQGTSACCKDSLQSDRTHRISNCLPNFLTSMEVINTLHDKMLVLQEFYQPQTSAFGFLYKTQNMANLFSSRHISFHNFIACKFCIVTLYLCILFIWNCSISNFILWMFCGLVEMCFNKYFASDTH